MPANHSSLGAWQSSNTSGGHPIRSLSRYRTVGGGAFDAPHPPVSERLDNWIVGDGALDVPLPSGFWVVGLIGRVPNGGGCYFLVFGGLSL